MLASNITESGGQFTEKGYLREPVVFHSGDMACPSELYFQEHCLNADALCSLQNLDVCDVVIPFYLEYGSEATLMEAFQEADVTSVGDP